MATATTTPAAGDNFLEIRYTTDGSTWNSLGLINESNWQQPQFSLPITAWDDLKNLQVSIRSLNVSDVTPAVYLDGMSIDVEYAPAQELSKDTTASSSTAPGSFQLAATSSSADVIALSLSDNGEGVQEIAIKAVPATSLIFYDLDDPSFSLSSAIGDQPLVMPVYNFSSGDFVVVDTSDPNGCNGMSIDGCRAEGAYLGEAAFSVQ